MNNKKTLSIILIIILSIIIIALCAFMTLVIVKKDTPFNYKFFKFNGKEKLVNEINYTDEEIKKINIKVKSEDINILKSNDSQIVVKIYGDSKEDFDVSLSDGNLNVSSSKQINICLFCINFDSRIDIYLPESYDKEMILKTASGDIDIGEFKNSDVLVNATSGDVVITKVNDFTVNTVSGDVDIMEGNNGVIKTTSGDINAGTVHSLDASAVSGDIEIRKAIIKNIKTTSGDIDITSAIIETTATINSTSGRVKINKTNDVYVNHKTTSGRVQINESSRHSQNELNISTVSGNIRVN